MKPPSASVLKGGRVVFNIAGNKHRLVVPRDYERQTCFVKLIGTHEQYDPRERAAAHDVAAAIIALDEGVTRK